VGVLEQIKIKQKLSQVTSCVINCCART